MGRVIRSLCFLSLGVCFVLAMLVLVAPFIGLGAGENFVLYRHLGMPRREALRVLLIAAVFPCAVLLMLRAWLWLRAEPPLRVLRNAAVLILICLPFLLGGEVWLRWRAYHDYIAHDPNYRAILYSENINAGPVDWMRGIPDRDSTVGLFKEDRLVTLSYLDRGGYQTKRVDFRLNNVGLIAPEDVPVEPRVNEFRIVVLGNEQTAPTTANIAWPTHLQKSLQDDELFRKLIDGKKPVVINFGWPDAGFLHYLRVLERVRKFKPDMILLNVAAHDFDRAPNEDALRAKKAPRKGPKPFIEFGAVAGLSHKAVVVAQCLDEPVDLDNVTCRFGRPHTFFADRPVIDDLMMRGRIQETFVRGYAKAAFVSPTYSALWWELTGRHLDPEAIRNAQWPIDKIRGSTVPKTPSEKMDAAVKVVQVLQSEFLHVLITRNVWYSEMIDGDEDFARTRELAARVPDAEIVITKPLMPEPRSTERVASWYIVPGDASKWSEKGHEVYAEVMHGVVHDYVREHVNAAQ